jgi:CHAT domain
VSRSSAWGKRLGGAAWAVLTVLHVLPGATAPREPARLEPPPVQWGHCTTVVRGPVRVCLYDPDDPVRLWVDHPRAGEARVRIDGVEVAVERYSLADEPQGQGLRVAIPPGAWALELEVPDAEGVRAWGLALAQGGRATLGFEALGAAWASKDVARIEHTARAKAEALEADGWREEAAFILCATSFHLRDLRAFAAAERLLVRAEALAGASSATTAAVSTYRGLLLWSQGSLHAAATRLRDGARLSLRIEDAGGLVDSLPIYAEALAALGYHQEARHWAQTSLRYLPSTSCERAAVLRTLGWIDLVLRASDQPHDDPRTHLREAIALQRTQSGCTHKQGGARLSLALLAFQDGDVAQAGEELAAIDDAWLSAGDRVRAADLRVRLAAATTGDAATVWLAWHELEAAARVVDDDDAWWRVDVRRGEILLREHDGEAALAALRRAEQRLDRLVRVQAVVGVGRTATADRYLEGTTALVSRLVEEGQRSEALCVAREARARRRSAAAGLDVLPAAERAAVQEEIRRYREHKLHAERAEALIAERPQEQESALRDEAERASQAAGRLVDAIVGALIRATASPRCEELVPAAPGELLVGVYPREHDWLVLVQDEHGATQAHSIAAPTAEHGDPEALGRRLLGPIDGSLAMASRVRVLADREAQAIDVHLLPWRGQPLSAQMAVTYGVELNARLAQIAEGPPRALLLADPTGTLRSARVEVQEVAERLTAAGWTIVGTPASDGDAGSAEVGFAGLALLHYAAHTATREQASGVWAPYPAGEAKGLPHLQLGPTARLEVHDILALRPVPPVAFLAGCKTGLAELDAGSTSVALAFLLADGQQVVASRENVDDAVGLEIARRFYASFVHGGDAAVAMHEVQAALQREGKGVVPYRVWVR